MHIVLFATGLAGVAFGLFILTGGDNAMAMLDNYDIARLVTAAVVCAFSFVLIWLSALIYFMYKGINELKQMRLI